VRVLTIVGLVWVCAAPTLDAQVGDQLEVGTFGSLIRFDNTWNLPNRAGAGGRVGYFISENFGLEVEGIWLRPNTVTGDTLSTLHVVSGHLLLGGGSERMSLHILAGGSWIKAGTISPYDFAVLAASGGLGIRLLLSDHLTLRADAHGYYTPSSTMKKSSSVFTSAAEHVSGSLGLSFLTSGMRGGRFLARASRGSVQQGGLDERLGGRHYKWYWGGQGGVLSFQTNAQGYTFGPVIGGHWLITARRTALYVAYEQAYFFNDANAIITDPQSTSSSVGPGYRDVTFDHVRRIMFGVVAFPTEKHMEPMAGLGFALMRVPNPVVDCSSCVSNAELVAAQDRAEDAASKAFVWLMGGIAITQGKLSLFGQYILMSAAQGFLLQGNTHALQGGVRYSLGRSKEGVTEPR